MSISFKYKFLKGIFKVLHLKKVMQLPPEKIQKIFKLAYKGENVPKLSDPEFDYKVEKVEGCSVVWFKHKKENNRVCFYLVGGGMLKYPKPIQIKQVLQLAKECDIDFLVPYYPVVFTGHNLLDTYDMLYALYKKALEHYSPENIYFLGGSSGGNLALGLISHINAKGEGLPKPGKIYASSPGSLFISKEEEQEAEKLEKTDVIMSQKAIYSIWEGMTAGKEVPEYMKYLQLGDYTGLKSTYISFGGDEVFSAIANSIKKRLEECGVDVTLEIGEGMYHSYAGMPLVNEAKEANQRMKDYIKN